MANKDIVIGGDASFKLHYVDLGGGVYAQAFVPVDAAGAVISASGAGTLSSPPAALTASTDTLFTFAAQVHHVFLQNNSSTPVGVNFDAVATAGSLQVAANGGYLFFDVPATVVHLYSTAATAVNGTSGSNIVLKAWL